MQHKRATLLPSRRNEDVQHRYAIIERQDLKSHEIQNRTKKKVQNSQVFVKYTQKVFITWQMRLNDTVFVLCERTKRIMH